MKIFTKIFGDTLIIGFEGELDHSSSVYIKPKLDGLLERCTSGKIVFDVSSLSFMDSTGIGVFLGRYKKMRARGVPIFLAGAKGSVDKVFNIAGIYKVMPRVR